ncbi:unnamed protein product, partial [Prorocentrum cordatum]
VWVCVLPARHRDLSGPPHRKCGVEARGVFCWPSRKLRGGGGSDVFPRPAEDALAASRRAEDALAGSVRAEDALAGSRRPAAAAPRNLEELLSSVRRSPEGALDGLPAAAGGAAAE